MWSPISRSRQYYSVLTPAALPQLLQQVIRPKPTRWWHRLSWVGRATCWGEVASAVYTFSGRLHRGSRSFTVQFKGYWQVAPNSTGSLIYLQLSLALWSWLVPVLWLLIALGIGLLNNGLDPVLLLFIAVPALFFAGTMYFDIYLADEFLRRELKLVPYQT